MSRSYLFILCDNGFGHSRRGAAVAAALRALEPDAEIVILGDPAHVAKFGAVSRPFRTHTSADALRAGIPDATEWFTRLPDISRFDVVVSDNLPEVLAIRQDALLMGSFLWNLILRDTPVEWRKRAERLLHTHRPPLLANGPFVPPEVRACTKVIDVGFVVGEPPIPPVVAATGRDALLLSCGASGVAEDLLRDFVLRLSVGDRPNVRTVYVEPSLLPHDAPGWMQPADFSTQMYASLMAAVIRPGMGTISDTLRHGAPVFCFYESNNKEMAGNARVIEALGVGNNLGTVSEAFATACKVIRDSGSWTRLACNIGRLDFTGARRSAHFLASYGRR